MTIDELRRLAQLAHLAPSDETLASLHEDLTRILSYVEQLQEVDLRGVEPTRHPVALELRLEEDVLGDELLSNAEAVAPAASSAAGYVSVPRVVDA